MNTPKLGLPYLDTGQAQKEVTHNEALNILDVLVQGRVIDAVTTDPPGAPNNGEAWIIPDEATGDWAGKEAQIAAWFSGWKFLVPAAGWRVHNLGDGKAWTFDGAAWAPIAIDHSPGAWQIPALDLGWIGLGGAWQNPRYRKAKNGMVSLEGAMQHATASTDGVIFTLLEGFRPENDLIFTGWTAGGPCRWNIYANGDVEVASSNQFGTSFSGISFFAV